MRILVIGGGGREHALAWRFALDGHDVYAAPGNPGIAQVAKLLATTDYLAAAESVHPDLTVVGPEAPLVAGVTEQFRLNGFRIVGPSPAAAQLEASKIHAKQLMMRTGIPTARFVQCFDIETAIGALGQFEFPVVVKADGLAAGKGVTIAASRDEAESAVRKLGPRLVIEEFLEGEEVSFIALCDGKNAVYLEPTQDHKAVGDNDTGPNTGGMGAYCDGRLLTSEQCDAVMDQIINPAVAASEFTGFLYAGLMLTKSGPKVLEFNVRLGDPETQALMVRLNCDFGAILAEQSVRGIRLDWRPEPSVCVVMAAAGYPGKPRLGDRITGIESCGAEVFHSGTRMGPSGLETAGGRVLGVTALGKDLGAAVSHAYQAVDRIHFQGMHFRRDISKKGLRRWTTATIDSVGT